jgi:O-antigen/teichoic acid export membrane protein
MLKKIIGTAGTRILNAVINLIILLLITNKIGSEGFGVIALIMVDITIIQMFVDLLAGSALIYFGSRANTGQLLVPAYIWIGFVIAVFAGISFLTHTFFPDLYGLVIPSGYEVHIFALALLSALMITHYNLLLGKKEIRIYNIIFTVQILTFLGVFVYGIFGQQNLNPMAYVNGLYVAYGAGSILGFIVLKRKTDKFSARGWTEVFKKVITFGFISSVANIIHIGNKRLSFYVLRYFSGLSALGVYNTGVQLTEGLRIIGQSISLVQYSTISNTSDEEYARLLTIKLMKFTLLLTLSALIVLIILPEQLYSFVFSKNFADVKPIVVALSPGVLALAANNIFSHYFSGLGDPKVSVWSNVVGFVFTVTLAFTLIPAFGYIGAAVTASASYTATVIYQYIIFEKRTQTKFGEWLPRKKDFTDFGRLVQEVLKRDQ